MRSGLVRPSGAQVAQRLCQHVHKIGREPFRVLISPHRTLENTMIRTEFDVFCKAMKAGTLPHEVREAMQEQDERFPDGWYVPCVDAKKNFFVHFMQGNNSQCEIQIDPIWCSATLPVTVKRLGSDRKCGFLNHRR